MMTHEVHQKPVFDMIISLLDVDFVVQSIESKDKDDSLVDES
jgi:hypothetical protein